MKKENGSRKGAVKTPKQARSRATAKAIEQASSEVFEASAEAGRGLAGTAAAVAKRAGVSVGTLYQYFPNKDALIARYLQRRFEEDIALMEALAAVADREPRALLRTVSQAFVQLIVEERALYEAVVPLLGEIEAREDFAESMQRAVVLFARWLEPYDAQLRPLPRETLALTVFYGLRAAIFAVLRHAPDSLENEAFAELLAAGAWGFLSAEPWSELG
ncbi:MAG: TetR/AcrR family transcriptional regulator [Myxococcota bacterium]